MFLLTFNVTIVTIVIITAVMIKEERRDWLILTGLKVAVDIANSLCDCAVDCCREAKAIVAT